MMRSRRSLALAALLLLAASSSAFASPELRLERCIGVDRGELGHAIERELESSPASAAAQQLVISASCEDGARASATVLITERSKRREAQRVLALDEVAAELRPRLLAMVAVELAESLLATPEPPAPVVAPAPATIPSPALQAVRSSRRSPARRSFGVALGSGTRIYEGAPDPLHEISLELESPWITAGLVGAIGSSIKSDYEDYIGHSETARFRPYLAGLTLRRQIYCLTTQRNALCLAAHLEGGFTAITDDELPPAFQSYTDRSLYLLGAAVLEGRRRIGPFEAALRLELGWADGSAVTPIVEYVSPFPYLVFDPVVSFGGRVTMVNLGFRWMP